MADRLALRRMLRTILGLSKRIDKGSIEEIRKLVNEISTSILEIDLTLNRAKIFAATIYEDPNISATVFGMRQAGSRIPLHGNFIHSFDLIQLFFFRSSMQLRIHSSAVWKFKDTFIQLDGNGCWV